MEFILHAEIMGRIVIRGTKLLTPSFLRKYVLGLLYTYCTSANTCLPESYLNVAQMLGQCRRGWLNIIE